jgi:hypothetical protein
LPEGKEFAVLTRHDLPVGTPLEILARWPDILEAEQHFRAANANIWTVRARFFPSISLIGSGGSGTGSNQLENLFKSVIGYWNFAPTINQPIFNARRNLAGWGRAGCAEGSGGGGQRELLAFRGQFSAERGLLHVGAGLPGARSTAPSRV